MRSTGVEIKEDWIEINLDTGHKIVLSDEVAHQLLTALQRASYRHQFRENMLERTKGAEL